MFGNFGIFLNRRTLFVVENTISDVIFLGRSFPVVILVNDSELLVDDFDFLDK